MIVNSLNIELPIGESFKIRKNRYFDTNQEIPSQKRASIVSGIHGDELEGQYVCYLLCEWLNSNQDKIKGIIDIYPALNSLGVDSITRSIPFYNVDLNRVFPGSKEDFLPAQIADAIIEEISGSAIAIDIHSSNIFLREIPQIRMSQEYSKELLPMAKTLGIDFVWIHDAVTVLESTFAHSMNSRGTKTLVVEMGVGMRITQEYGINLVEGIKNLLAKEGILDIEQKELKKPIISENGKVFYINSDSAGLFVPTLSHCDSVKKGDLVGKIVSPINGTVEQSIYSPADGILFTLREYPIVYEGSLIARIFGE
ncbi:MAG: M14 family metallopeptidase [Arcobacteraceae bacterium]|nr:M14 family metallopeptidase [Arcobacteraceae bacterium]